MAVIGQTEGQALNTENVFSVLPDACPGPDGTGDWDSGRMM